MKQSGWKPGGWELERVVRNDLEVTLSVSPKRSNIREEKYPRINYCREKLDLHQ